MKINWDKVLDYVAWVTIALGVIIIVTFWLKLWPIRAFFSSTPIDFSNSGQAGDFIGGTVGTIWALTAVLLLYSTLRLQRKELAETQEILAQQTFESTFFHMLDNQRSIVNEIAMEQTFHFVDTGIHARSGRRFFVNSLKELRELTKRVAEWNRGVALHIREIEHLEDFGIDPNDIRVDIESVYGYFHNTYKEELGHYFRHLYYLLKYLEDEIKLKHPGVSPICMNNESIRKHYTKYIMAIQAQMSSSELSLLLYNGLKYEKARDIVDRFKLLDGTLIEDLLDETVVQRYRNTEFKRRNQAV